jgi:hypothetical protein
MRRTIATLAVGVLVGALVAPNAASAGPEPASGADRAALKAELELAKKTGSATKAPTGPNPYLAYLEDGTKADYAAWRRQLATKGDERAKRLAQQRALQDARVQAAQRSPILVDELEDVGTFGDNDSFEFAQRIDEFGTSGGRNPKAEILGDLAPPETVTAEDIAPNTEDDGAIPLARDTGVRTDRDGFRTTGVIGDGPHGSAGTGTGDFDYYRVQASAGEKITVDMDTPTGPLDTVVVIWDAAGTIVASNDDSGGSFDSFVEYPVTVSGAYYVMVTGFISLPADPNDPASGDGAASEGPYTITTTVAREDVDVYAFRLRKGDVLGASVTGSAAWLTVLDPTGRNVHGSNQDASFIYSANTPLPGGGNAVTDHVAETANPTWHYLAVRSGEGPYRVSLQAYRPGLEGANKPTQTLLLDFDGAQINTFIFGGSGVRTLSPFRAFLTDLGVTAAQERNLIRRITAVVEENIKRDLAASGLAGQFDIKVVNSLDKPNAFPGNNVSRVIIGGTREESGINTIGIAQSIDVGNFDANESALVLMDILAGPAGSSAAAINTYLTPASDRLRFIATAIGNVTAHEAGHFFGDFHVDQFNAQANIMDQGGNAAVMFGVGPDGVGGTADDVDVDFGEDVFNPNEGFTGIEDTRDRIKFVLVE